MIVLLVHRPGAPGLDEGPVLGEVPQLIGRATDYTAGRVHGVVKLAGPYSRSDRIIEGVLFDLDPFDLSYPDLIQHIAQPLAGIGFDPVPVHLEYVIGFKGTRLFPFQCSPGLRDHVENVVGPLVQSLPGEAWIAGVEVLQRRLEVRLVNSRKIGAFLRGLFGQLRPTLRAVEELDSGHEPVELAAPHYAIAVGARAV